MQKIQEQVADLKIQVDNLCQASTESFLGSQGFPGH